jgi:hypothetical protein
MLKTGDKDILFDASQHESKAVFASCGTLELREQCQVIDLSPSKCQERSRVAG